MQRTIHQLRQSGVLSLVVLVAIVIVLWTAGGADASGPLKGLLAGPPPPAISYQGLVQVADEPYTGTGYFKFAIVNAGGDASYWSNDGTSTGGGEPTGAVALAVEQGLFNVLLGDTSLGGMSQPLDENALAETNTYLRLWFSPAQGGPYEQLAPDQRIASVAYALRAKYADNPGPTGPTGPQGPSGPQGVQGPAGATGPAGADGPSGPSGPQGPQGVQGPAGATGPSGPSGPSGPQGAQGPAGETGPAGADGPSGPSGPQGTQGVQGPAGTTGPAGASGPSGPSGPQGTQGTAGTTGPAGAAGPSGPSGPQGPQGPAGTMGPAGPSGPSGPAGPVNTTALTCYIMTGGLYPSSDGSLQEGRVVGEIVWFAGVNRNFADAVPCDGRILSVSAYSALYSIIGNTYGGNGSTTFAVPNLNNRAPVGR